MKDVACQNLSGFASRGKRVIGQQEQGLFPTNRPVKEQRIKSPLLNLKDHRIKYPLSTPETLEGQTDVQIFLRDIFQRWHNSVICSHTSI